MPLYIPRIVDAEIDDLFQQLSVIVLEGPKAVGKTATAARRAATVFNLDTPAHRQLAEVDPGIMLDAPAPVPSTSGSMCRRSGTPSVGGSTMEQGLDDICSRDPPSLRMRPHTPARAESFQSGCVLWLWQSEGW